MSRPVKVPVIMQMEALECGAASLAMIMAYYKKWIPLEQVRYDCGVSRDGSSAKNVLQAARSYGMKAQGYKYGLEDIKQIKCPVIIHWNFNHFVVLNGFKRNKAVLNDPARGVVEVSMEEFDESFTGIVLCFEPSEDFVPGGKKRSVLNFAKSRLKGALGPFLFVFFATILIKAIELVSPVFNQIYVDRILTQKNPDWLVPFLLLMGALLVYKIIIYIMQQVYMLRISGKFAVVANSTFMWHVLRLPMDFFSQRYAGDIAEKQSSNEGIANTLIQELAPLFLDLVTMILYLFMMIKYNMILTAVGIGSAVLNMVFANIISKKRINLTRVTMRDAGKLSSTTMSGIQMVETLKSSGAENGFFERWSGYAASLNATSVNFVKSTQFLTVLPSICNLIATNLTFGLGIYLIMDGQFTIGMMTAFNSFLAGFMSPVSSIIGVGQSIQEMRTDMERVEDVMNYKPDVEYTDEEYDPKGMKKLSGNVEIKNITFGYNRMNPPLIEDFSLTLKPGSKVAFVGASGCGKSTLSKLISGLYSPWSGEILFDGEKRENIRREVFTSSLSVVDQDIIIFEDSISDNIKMWDKSIQDFEVIMAARDAQIHEDIMKREGGYDFVLREGGKNFSGGQRQRLEIARVLAMDPTIVILDEATSALDAKTEYEVIKSIKDRGITCIIVAHRLSTIRDCDEIIVMDNGKVIERGTHEELFAKNGKYTQLITTE